MGTHILQTSFALGILIATGIYCLAYFKGKKLPQIRSYILVIGAVLVAASILPIQTHWWMLFKASFVLTLCVLLLALITKKVARFLQPMYESINLPSKIEKAKYVLYGVCALIILTLVIWGSTASIESVYEVGLNVLFGCVGILLALMLLFRDDTKSELP